MIHRGKQLKLTSSVIKQFSLSISHTAIPPWGPSQLSHRSNFNTWVFDWYRNKKNINIIIQQHKTINRQEITLIYQKFFKLSIIFNFYTQKIFLMYKIYYQMDGQFITGRMATGQMNCDLLFLQTPIINIVNMAIANWMLITNHSCFILETYKWPNNVFLMKV